MCDVEVSTGGWAVAKNDLAPGQVRVMSLSLSLSPSSLSLSLSLTPSLSLNQQRHPNISDELLSTDCPGGASLGIWPWQEWKTNLSHLLQVLLSNTNLVTFGS